MLESLAQILVTIAGLYLLALGAAAIVVPHKAAAFLNGFASSARAHYSEISIRLVVGIALVLAAPEMRYSQLFLLFGWMIVITSVCLLCMPWQWHHRFASKVVPPLTSRVWVFALLAIPLGCVMLYALLSGD